VLTVGQGADERQISPQIANSVTIEVNAEGAQKVALARTVGTLSLSLRASSEGGGSTDGLTTISSFGGSVAAGASDAAGAVIEAIAAEGPEAQKFKTVIVTRGTNPQSYQVVAPDK
ncbi:MAG: Flp pilus assembly protein CpaB, partial [Mesorhizobium sp.]